MALDQAYGLRPEVYEWLTLPETFQARLELMSRVETAPALLFGARRLLIQMCGWLAARRMAYHRLEGGELLISVGHVGGELDCARRIYHGCPKLCIRCIEAAVRGVAEGRLACLCGESCADQ